MKVNVCTQIYYYGKVGAIHCHGNVMHLNFDG